MNDVTTYFNAVYDATFRELMRRCLLKVPIEDADDLLQNTYAQFYRILRRKGSEAIRDPKAYLITTLRHEIASYYRSRTRRKESPLTDIQSDVDADDVEDLILNNTAVCEIIEKLKAEPERTQRMFILYYGYGMKLGDIARAMDTTAASVKARLLRVRKKMKTTFKEEDR